MKKAICILASAFLLSGGAVFAQGEMDAYKFSQYDLSGTARYLGMGGAFGALGGDISAMGGNPAGLGIYRSSEIVTTLSLSSMKTNTEWSGTKMDENRTKFNFDNIAYVGYFPTGNDEGLIGWNVGFAYNRVKNFNRRYRMGRGPGGFSLSDYIATLTNRAGVTGNDLLISDSHDPYMNQDWLSVMGYDTNIIGSANPSQKGGFHSSFGTGVDGTWQNWEVQQADMYVNESGAVDKYDFSLATNISNAVFIGATVSVTDLNYHLSSVYDENFGFANNNAANSDNLFLDNYSSVDGTGYSFNLGVIARPSDFLRLGVAYNSPTWYKMKNYYRAEAGAYIEGFFANDPKAETPNLNSFTSTPDGAFTEYRLRTSDRWIFSAAAIIGQTALISVDYELTRYKAMHLSGWAGEVEGWQGTVDNDYIKEDFGLGGLLKMGTEVKITPQFAIRAGGAWQHSPAKSTLLYDEKGDGVMALNEISTTGTNTAYTVDRNVGYITVGLGYRFTPNFYADLACVYRMQKEDVYPFSNIYDGDGNVLVESIPATLKTNTTKVALTLGYKF